VNTLGQFYKMIKKLSILVFLMTVSVGCGGDSASVSINKALILESIALSPLNASIALGTQ